MYGFLLFCHNKRSSYDLDFTIEEPLQLHIYRKSFTLPIALALSVPTTSAFAQSPIHPNDFASETDTEAIYEEMEKLSVDELQAYISECAEYNTNIEDKSAIQKAPITNVAAAKSAWLAAAAIASKEGYPLAATIVVSSVGDENYSEVNGQFAKAIKKTSIYDSMVKNGSVPNIFTKSMNPDLFYAIHKFDYSTSGGGSGARLRVHDIFNFEIDATYKDLFTTIINDAGYLMEWAHVLNEIDVNIFMDI